MFVNRLLIGALLGFGGMIVNRLLIDRVIGALLGFGAMFVNR